jgi:hypothetical protein
MTYIQKQILTNRISEGHKYKGYTLLQHCLLFLVLLVLGLFNEEGCGMFLPLKTRSQHLEERHVKLTEDSSQDNR